MNAAMTFWAVCLATLTLNAGAQETQPSTAEETQPAVAGAGSAMPPLVARPCKPGACPFAGQSVTVLMNREPRAGALGEVKAEFEAATGATLNLVQVPFQEFFPTFMSDLTNARGRYDAAYAPSWWLGELVSGGHLVAYDKYYADPRFPKWDIDQVLAGPRRLLSYGGRRYMVANDHDGQVMFYRRDLLADPQHRRAFAARFGYELDVPSTWKQFRDVAEYFNGKDLNGDGVPDYGVSMYLELGVQGMFHFMSFSAPFVIGPRNPNLYWFDPATMKPLIDSPGHVRALEELVELSRFGPKEMLQWDLVKTWGLFLSGRAALAFSWGDLAGMAQDPPSQVRGRTGSAPMPGTTAYYSIPSRRWISTGTPNRVGNTTGASWAGVISKYSRAPEAAYYLFALMATREKSQVYAVRGWDGIDPGRTFHFLPPDGMGHLETYVTAGWDEADVRDYLRACFLNLSNPLQLPYLRIPGAYSYWQVLDVHLAAAAAGQLDPAAALKAATVDFEEITIRLGRESQRRAYLSSLGLSR
ncbi:MAG: extracellular solute-binding protein [Piscinibacter sp.]|nr:extracellular solute-binding protein [Piscinibacter sp.]